MKIRILCFLGIIGLLASGCQRIPEAIGSDTGVTVVCDSTIYAAIGPALESALQKEIYTPQPEYLLEIHYLPPEELNKVVVRRNIILAGLLGAEDKISKQVRGMLPAGAIDQVEQQKSFVFRKENPWARKQLLLVLVSTDTSALKDQIAANNDYLFDVMRSHIIEQTKQEMYSQYEQHDVSDDLLAKYHWRVRVQHDYLLWKEESDENFVTLRRTSPERWLFVYWQESANPDSINSDWALAKRNEIGRRFYEFDKVSERYLNTRETEFAGRRAVELRGLWENDKKVAAARLRLLRFMMKIQSVRI
ncbi:MAG: DUF4837 family protein [bacterium]